MSISHKKRNHVAISQIKVRVGNICHWMDYNTPSEKSSEGDKKEFQYYRGKLHAYQYVLSLIDDKEST